MPAKSEKPARRPDGTPVDEPAMPGQDELIVPADPPTPTTEYPGTTTGQDTNSETGAHGR